jgi:hypothetical protein
MLANITNNRTTKQKSFSNLNLYVTEFVKLEKWWYHSDNDFSTNHHFTFTFFFVSFIRIKIY